MSELFVKTWTICQCKTYDHLGNNSLLVGRDEAVRRAHSSGPSPSVTRPRPGCRDGPWSAKHWSQSYNSVHKTNTWNIIHELLLVFLKHSRATDNIPRIKTSSIFLPFCRRDSGRGSRPPCPGSRRSRHKEPCRQCSGTCLSGLAGDMRTSPCGQETGGTLKQKYV